MLRTNKWSNIKNWSFFPENCSHLRRNQPVANSIITAKKVKTNHIVKSSRGMTKENILTDRDLAANVTIYLICWENQ